VSTDKQPPPTAANTPIPANSTAGLLNFARALEAGGVGDKIEPDPTDSEPTPSADDPLELPPTDEKKPVISKPKKLKELGAAAKLTDDELYGIEVPSSVEGEKPYTLGELKDFAKEQDDFRLSKLENEQHFRDREAKILRAESELTDILAAIPKDAIPDKLRADLQARRDKAVKEERQRVLDVIPGWQDREVRTQELAAMVEHMKDNGFPEGYLANVLDHRTLRYIRSNMVRERNLKAALAKVQQRKSSTPAKASRPAAQPRPQNANGRPSSREQRQQESFASALFGNQTRS